ncbi:bifunctional non-homologous end joining protein LigD [Murinocardiopsis flavida]|uniref:Bifunctional non-homologous end joining protein LigD n=1 Tax=Murinocardiopsis flavida TaxID=645275 RepID=A0A2P8CLY1_9ACTN|nr:non-homologous end-joining DNA ligase [Murinocardiopsis flavida]PSK85979.1 bifunctional non-homologous end joining protein LigD [Murinocardiopsis flavida]
MSADRAVLRSGRHTVRLGRPDKELFGSGGPTKRELAEHYRSVAPRMLPHIRRRPIAMHRFPDGIGSERVGGFFEKRRPDHAPDFVGSVEVPREQGGSIPMVVCDDTATLLWLADQAVITPHPWLSRAGALRTPDRIILDLDPSDDDFAAVRTAAHRVRAVLDGIGLAAFVMTTGSRGLHVVAPIRPEMDVDEVRALARGIAEATAAGDPDRLTTEVRKDKRRGRLFLDYLRNSFAQHAVAPYAVRALPDAPVATPVPWEELDGVGSAREWTVRAPAARADCPWKGLNRHARSPGRAAARLERARPPG